MKKFFFVFLMAAICFSLSACTNNLSNNNDSESSISNATLQTDEAKLKDSDAVELIKSLSDDELGIDDDRLKDCSFMVQSDGVLIDGNSYIKVIAALKNQNDDGTFSFDIKGEYYISYDATVILKKSNDTYTALKP